MCRGTPGLLIMALPADLSASIPRRVSSPSAGASPVSPSPEYRREQRTAGSARTTEKEEEALHDNAQPHRPRATETEADQPTLAHSALPNLRACPVILMGCFIFYRTGATLIRDTIVFQQWLTHNVGLQPPITHSLCCGFLWVF